MISKYIILIYIRTFVTENEVLVSMEHVNIALGNGLVPSGFKTLHDPLLTQTYDNIWHQ